MTLLALLLLGTGCGSRSSDEDSAPPDPARNGVLVSDRLSRLRSELEAADRRFARDVKERGLDAWVEAFADDGSVLPPEGPIVAGRETIRDLYSPLFADPSFAMSWEPDRVEVSSAGDLGYTFGRWTTSTTENGAVERATGRYLTIWRRAEDGRWRVLVDIGNLEAGSGAPLAR